jgi:selenium metabolism protein YedF
METKLLDCTKLECPMPVIKAKQELEKEGEMLLDVIVDNEIAVQNLTKLANSMGYKSSSKKQDENFCVNIEKNANTSLNQDKSNLKIVEERQTILIKTSFLGVGDDSLGSTLMKGFIFTLTQSKPLPKKVMFLNSGVKLTTENEETVKNLQILEKEGTELVSCGTCLDFYNLKDKLKVGSVGNMYDIVDSLNQSSNKLTI